MIEQNATNAGDYLWTNMIVGEVFPTPITPSTWSVWQDYFSKLSFGDTPSIDSIAGRPYLNYSATYSFLKKLVRKDERVRAMISDSIGVPPEGVEIPSFPISWKTVLFQILPREIKNELKKRKLKKNTFQFLKVVRDRCQEFQRRIGDMQRNELISLWTDEISPLWNEIHFLQDKQNEELNLLMSGLKTELTNLFGDEEPNMLLATISSAGELASVGPLVGLFRLSTGEIDRQEYLQRYGHRGPNENELAEPRQYEDPHWLDRQLEEFRQSPVDVSELLAKRDAESAAVLGNIKARLTSGKAQAIERRVHAIEKTNSEREDTRSELTRLVSVIRTWYLRAGELTGLDDGVFFLRIDQVVEMLAGDVPSLAQIAARREAFERYKALPSLPVWIRGRFDPFQWAADPHRRMDVFDPKAPPPAAVPRTDTVIKGHPGSAGRVEGLVRQISRPDQGDRLQPGEILVTSTTNVGWTPLFPRAAAVITDVGGSLSHAAIVARELGIPAVVGCGNATTRLRDGDRVRVDGGKGLVEILPRSQDV
jgi:phosphohistidine swiveling domain-containing protein